jgi:hypothetical protein
MASFQELVVLWHPPITTVLCTGLGVFGKLLSRRNSDTSPERNDVYMGQPLMLASVSATSLFVVKCLSLAKFQEGVSLLLIALLYIVFFVVLVYIDKKLAWRSVRLNEVDVFERKFWWGILIPNAVGMGCLYTVFVYAHAQKI